MSYYYIKALHIIFVVTWFAGLFYIVRLFIYHSEAKELSEPERSILITQYKIMQKRLWYGITWPSAVLTFFLGGSLIKHHIPLSDNPWLKAKLFILMGLYLYHFLCGKIYKDLTNDRSKLTSGQLRLWNEVATLFLFAIVFLVVVKSLNALWWGVTGISILAIVLIFAIKIYKNIRFKKSCEL